MILASIVTYNPEIQLLRQNIDAIKEQVDDLIIIDNNSNNREDLIELLKCYEGISLTLNDKNEGIAFSLNQALSYSAKNYYTWLLTLDQDSVCEKDMIENYFQHIKTTNMENVLLVCPSIKDFNLRKPLEKKSGFEEVITAITSGSLLNVNYAIKIGGFLNSLFIDYVDFEFCLRGKKSGLKIHRLKNVVLNHTLGQIKEKKIWGYNIVLTNHAPIRRYYLYRNKVYVYKKYYTTDFKWVLRNFLSSLKVFILIIFFESNKRKNTKYIFKGIFKGITAK